MTTISARATVPWRRRIGWTAAAAVAGAGLWWAASGLGPEDAERDVLALAKEGQPALAGVESFPEEGREHLKGTAKARYGTDPPLSGDHDPKPTEPGVYHQPQPPAQIVHALEHGNIVIHFDTPGPAALERIAAWAELYDGAWDGIVAVRRAGLGEAIILTAWTKRLRQDRFAPAPAAAFIDAFRGRGPEKPVR
ncbi:MAG: DUF3105 domain-containing protein [Alphaproteobacteria bacterium]